MPQPTLELADIFRQYGPAYRQAHALPLHQHRLMQAIETCRTAVLGGAVEWCDHCQYTHTRYRSCRDRHCPKCQGSAREKWLEQRREELLPTEYFHVVFTLPESIAAIAFYNKKAVYDTGSRENQFERSGAHMWSQSPHDRTAGGGRPAEAETSNSSCALGNSARGFGCRTCSEDYRPASPHWETNSARGMHGSPACFVN